MKSLLLVATLFIAGSLSACSPFEINEAICSKGEEPTWYANSLVGSRCIVDGDTPEAGEYRYPRGRVPQWINPPDSYDHKTDEGRDLYNVNPNDPTYPWWDEALAENPELTCVGADEPVTELTMKPKDEAAPKVIVVQNTVGNRCFGFEWARASSVVSSSLTVTEMPNGAAWKSDGTDDATAKELLRVGTDYCLRVTAALEVEGADGETKSYELKRAKVQPDCVP